MGQIELVYLKKIFYSDFTNWLLILCKEDAPREILKA